MADFSKRHPPGYGPMSQYKRDFMQQENLFFWIFVETVKVYLFHTNYRKKPRYPTKYFQLAKRWILHDLPMEIDGLEGEWSFRDFLTELIPIFPENVEPLRELIIEAKDSDISEWPNLINECLEYMSFIGTTPPPWWAVNKKMTQRHSEKDVLNHMVHPFGQGFREYQLHPEVD